MESVKSAICPLTPKPIPLPLSFCQELTQIYRYLNRYECCDQIRISVFSNISLGDGIWRIRLRGIEPAGVNAYLIDDGEITLIDVGMVWDSSQLDRGIRELGFELQDIDRILLTHFDIDHVGGLLRLSDIGAPVYLGRADLGIMSRSDDPPCPSHKGFVHRLLRRFITPPQQIKAIDDGQQIGNFTALHTPGHNPGHMVYIHQKCDFAAVGDLVRSNGKSLHPMYWFDSYDLDMLRQSVRKLSDRIPPLEIIAPGHGPPILNNGHSELARLAASF